MRIEHHHRHPAQAPRGARGFTLPEILASSVVGALLLTALAYATMEFTVGVTHMEQKAGISEGEDKVLRQITRDIREAWWAEVPNDATIRLSDPEGDVTEYYLEQGELKVLMPNGDTGTLLTGIADLVVEGLNADRHREGTAVDAVGSWYSRELPPFAAFALEVPPSGKISMAFQAPVNDAELPGGGVAGEEQVLDLGLTTLSLPIAWDADDHDDVLRIQVYETRGPGSAEPSGSALGVIEIDGDGLPAAVDLGGTWDTPSTIVSLDVSGIVSSLEPGVGYTVALRATGDSQIILAARPDAFDPDRDEVKLRDNWGMDYVELPVAVPYSLAGPYTLTSTVSSSAVTTVSITLIPENRPTQTRSATLLGQAVTEDPWTGVLPGESAP